LTTLGGYGIKKKWPFASTLQFVHKINSHPKASSLYCQWENVRRGEDARLVAIWIDREMRAFEAEFVCRPKSDERVKGEREVIGHRPLNVQGIEMGDIRTEEAQQQ